MQILRWISPSGDVSGEHRGVGLGVAALYSTLLSSLRSISAGGLGVKMALPCSVASEFLSNKVKLIIGKSKGKRQTRNKFERCSYSYAVRSTFLLTSPSH